MRICVNCGRILSDDETTCNCGEPAALPEEPSVEEFPELPAAETQNNGKKNTASEMRDKLARWKEDLSARMALRQEEKKQAETLARQQEKDSDAVFPVRKITWIGKIAYLLAVVLLIGGMLEVIIPMLRLREEPEENGKEVFLSLLTGTWTSDPFLYKNSITPSREILILRDDFTYESKVVTSPDDSDVYNEKTWIVTDSDSGSFDIDTERSALVVTYHSPDGTEVEYRRYIRKLNTGSLVLREYYNEVMSDYYDVEFRKGEK